MGLVRQNIEVAPAYSGVSNIIQFFLAGERRLAIEVAAARRPRFKQTADRTL
jgi:hypothetical protein